MTQAQLCLTSTSQDDKALSCRRWFISILLFNFNALILLLFGLNCLGCFDYSQKTLALEGNSKIEISKEVASQNEVMDWFETMSVKYARYQKKFPLQGMVFAKGVVPVGKSFVRVNILEINGKINPNIEIRPETAAEYLNSRVKINKIANKANAIAAVNGGYFKPQTGVPLGALVIDSKIITGPIYNRAAIGINFDGTYSIGNTDIKFALKNKKFNLKIDNINQPRMLSTYTLLYTEKWGKMSPPPPKYGLCATVKNGVVDGIYTSAVEIPKEGYVISGPKEAILSLKGQKKLVLDVEYPEAFKNSKHIISGGPFLLKDGKIYIDAKEEKLTAITGRNPRTLMGYTENNDLILVTVDGRETRSIGMNLYEAAKYMQKLGCKNAINLDGGSSSVMYLNGKVTNTPPQTGGIPISGAITISENIKSANK